MLNKITGCKSRTVPPLYVLIIRSFGESQSLEVSGKAERVAESSPRKARVRRPTHWILPPLRDYGGVLVAEKRLRRLKRTPQPICFGGFIMKNKKIVIAVIAFVAVVAIMAGLWVVTREEAVAGNKSITVTVVHADGTSKDFNYKTDAEYLGEVIVSEGLVEGQDGPYGLEISAVDGEAASWEANQSYWALFIGEEYATTGADGIVLTDGGMYKLVYTIG